LTEIGNKNLAVTYLTRARCFNNGFHNPIDLLVFDGQFELYFGQKINDVLRPPIELSVALLAPKAFDLCHGNALNPHFCEAARTSSSLKGLMIGDDHFHARGSRFVEHAV